MAGATLLSSSILKQVVQVQITYFEQPLPHALSPLCVLSFSGRG